MVFFHFRIIDTPSWFCRNAHSPSRTSIVDIGELPQPRNARRNGPLRKAPYLKKQNKKSLSTPSSGPTTPMMRSARSPLIPSSAPTSTSAEARAELDALRIPLIHLLALSAASEHSLTNKTKAPEDLVLKVLPKIAKKVNAGRQWALVDDAYKELDMYDFPYTSPDDREKAIGNCREAFHRLGLEKQAPEWRLLLPPEDREKADLNPELVPEPVKLADARPNVKPASESGRSPLLSSVETKKPAKETTKNTPKTTTKASKSDPIARIIGGKGKKKAVAPAKPKGPVGRPPKNPTASGKAAKPNPQKQTVTMNSRIKSAEVIVDSDEDVEMEDVKLSPPKQSIKKSVSPQPRRRIPASKPSSGTVSEIEADGIRLNQNPKRTPASTTAKSPAKKPRISEPSSVISNSPVRLHPQSNGYGKVQPSTIKPLPSKETLSQRSSSNSPPKPSPLGSSPPINASDVDAGSTSSSPSFMTSNAGTSTASQSPLDSLSGRGGQRPRYVPPTVSSLKRKAGSAPDRDDSIRSSFRPPTSAGNGMTSNKRQLVNLPDGQTMKLARKFKEDYSRYERLYREAQSTTDVSRKKEAIERVLSLHRDLERLKLRISNFATTNAH